MSYNCSLEDIRELKSMIKSMYLERARNVTDIDYATKYSKLKDSIAFGFMYEIMLKPDFFKRQGKEPKITLLMKYLGLAEQYKMGNLTAEEFDFKMKQLISNDLQELLES